jgi:hypothetical protein
MRKRIKFIVSEIVASPDQSKQAKLREAREFELKGHKVLRPTVRRPELETYISNPKGYDAYLTVGEGTL